MPFKVMMKRPSSRRQTQEPACTWLGMRRADEGAAKTMAECSLRRPPGEQADALLSASEAACQNEDEEANPDDDLRLDPMARHLACPLATSIPQSMDPAVGMNERLDLVRAQTLQEMFPALVRKAAWSISPDRRSATLRLEIGSGVFDGTTVLIQADLDEVRIELDTPPGIDLEAWKNRLRRRLASQGLPAHIS